MKCLFTLVALLVCVQLIQAKSRSQRAVDTPAFLQKVEELREAMKKTADTLKGMSPAPAYKKYISRIKQMIHAERNELGEIEEGTYLSQTLEDWNKDKQTSIEKVNKCDASANADASHACFALQDEIFESSINSALALVPEAITIINSLPEQVSACIALGESSAAVNCFMQVNLKADYDVHRVAFTLFNHVIISVSVGIRPERSIADANSCFAPQLSKC